MRELWTQCATAGRGSFVDQPSVAEPLERERRAIGCGSPFAIVQAKTCAEPGRRLEAARAPAAIDEEARHGRPADDRRAVRRHVDDAAPVAQHPQASEAGNSSQIASSVCS
jgi:hypothetical protein